MDLAVSVPKGMKKYATKQPPYPHMDGWLASRCLLTAPSGYGKQVVMLNLALKFWRGCFKRIILVSPTCKVDAGWEVLESYVRNVLKVPESEPWCYETFDEQVLSEILETHKKVIQYQKKHQPYGTIMMGILLLIDDFGSDIHIAKHNKILDKLFTAGRHTYVSTVFSQQAWRMASPTVRSQATLVLYGRPRSELDRRKFIEENGALAGGDKKLERLLDIATAEPYGWLVLDLLQQDPSKRFLKNFSHYLDPSK
jgi:hypothetical protein